MEFRYLEEEYVEEKKPLIGKRGKRIIWVAVSALIVVGIVRFALMFGSQIIAASSVKTLEKDFYSMEDGTVLFGRNFDYNGRKAMVVTTEPKNGYKSISTCNIEFLGMRNSWEPDDFTNKMMAISSVYVPVDGMNEKGVCVAVLSVSAGSATDQNTDKPDLTTTTAVRLILDKAASVDEAVGLLEQ